MSRLVEYGPLRGMYVYESGDEIDVAERLLDPKHFNRYNRKAVKLAYCRPNFIPVTSGCDAYGKDYHGNDLGYLYGSPDWEPKKVKDAVS